MQHPDESQQAVQVEQGQEAQLTKKQGCLGCGCLTLILLFLIGACGALFGEDESGDPATTPTASTARSTTTITPTVTVTPAETGTPAPETTAPSTPTSTPAPAITRTRTATPRPTPTRTSTPPPTRAPEPEQTSEPEPEPEDPGPVVYDNCSDVRAAGAAPIHAGEPGFGPHLDRDGDGVACET